MTPRVWQRWPIRCVRRVYAYIRRVTLKEDVAADLAQDTVVAVLNHLSGLRQHDRFWPWVFRIANNGIRQHYREGIPPPASALPSLWTGSCRLAIARTPLGRVKSIVSLPK